MKFKDWTIDDLIKHLALYKSSSMFDYRRVIRVSGEIRMRNGELKEEMDFEKELEENKKKTEKG